jgi:hypothetical protein
MTNNCESGVVDRVRNRMAETRKEVPLATNKMTPPIYNTKDGKEGQRKGPRQATYNTPSTMINRHIGQNGSKIQSADTITALTNELRMELGLADNALGNAVVTKIIKQASGDSKLAKKIIPGYRTAIKEQYPDELDELIILDYMDDEQYHKTSAPNMKSPACRYEVRNNVPKTVVYMQHSCYRPSLE